jgi:hypothetical protein
MPNEYEVFNHFAGIVETGSYLKYVKCAKSYCREVSPDYVNICQFGDYVESQRTALPTEVLCINADGAAKETWFTDREQLYTKTDKVGDVEIDGYIWDIRVPNDNPANIIGAFQYNGFLGEEVEFFKPVWGTTMRVRRGGWIAVNLSNLKDIWPIEENAMQELYRYYGTVL